MPTTTTMVTKTIIIGNGSRGNKLDYHCPCVVVGLSAAAAATAEKGPCHRQQMIDLMMTLLNAISILNIKIQIGAIL